MPKVLSRFKTGIFLFHMIVYVWMMFVCAFTCMWGHISAVWLCIYLCACVHSHVCEFTYMQSGCVYIYVCVCIYMYVDSHTCSLVVYIFVCVCVYVKRHLMSDVFLHHFPLFPGSPALPSTL